MDKLRVGIAGLGNFGELHLQAFSQLPYVRVTRLCSRSEQRARELAQRYDVPAISTDYAAFACADDVDVVSVVSSGRDHRAVAVPALEAGKHVLVEKPLAASLEDGEAIVAAARNARGKCMIAHICRFQPQFARAKQMIEEGRLGRIALIQAWRHNHYSLSASGMLQNPMRETAIHDIDLALWLTDSDVQAVSGYKSYHHSEREADTCCAIAKLTNGTICTFAAAWLRRDAMPADLDARMKIIGTQGELEISQPPHGFAFVDDHEHRSLNPEVARGSPVLLSQTGLMAEIEYFLKCVLEDRTPDMVPPEHGLKALKAAIAIDEACEVIR